MKKITFLLVLFGSLFAGCSKVEVNSFEECVQVGNPVMESYPRQCNHDGKNFVEELSLEEKCMVAQGTWIESANECEYISEDICNDLNGTFNMCGSACRNDSDAQICTKQCVPYCSFN